MRVTKEHFENNIRASWRVLCYVYALTQHLHHLFEFDNTKDRSPSDVLMC